MYRLPVNINYNIIIYVYIYVYIVEHQSAVSDNDLDIYTRPLNPFKFYLDPGKIPYLNDVMLNDIGITEGDIIWFMSGR